MDTERKFVMFPNREALALLLTLSLNGDVDGSTSDSSWNFLRNNGLIYLNTDSLTPRGYACISHLLSQPLPILVSQYAQPTPKNCIDYPLDEGPH